MQTLMVNYLIYFLVPLWLLAGTTDWFCHRAEAIENSTGAKESLIHLLMLGQIGIPVLACLFLEINALVLLVAIAGFLAHEATAFWDVSYAHRRRRIGPFEQHIHSFLEIIPLTALSGVIFLHWPQFLALFGRGDAVADFSLQLKAVPLPAGYIAVLLCSILLFQVLPYGEELWRGLRAGAQGKRR